MKLKSVFMALGVIATLTLVGGTTAGATSNQTTKKTETSAHKKAKKEVKKVTYKIKSGDSLAAIGKSHKTTYVRLFNANKSIKNPNVIDVGEKIRIPTKKEKLPHRYAKFMNAAVAVAPAQQQAAATTTYTTKSYSKAPVSSSSYYVGNGMWCTDYVHSKRSDVPIYGNANMSWISDAKADGKSTGKTPKKGAVAVTNGHVAYVEKVNSNGSYVVSEMGWNYKAGNYHKRTVSPGTFGGFIY